MITLVNVELSKIFRKWRTYIGFLAILVLVPIVQASFYYNGERYFEYAMQGIKNSFFFTGNLLNGYLISYIILQALIVHIPFLIVLVGGDLLAGEATSGTYRMLLTRPVSRFKLLTAKFIAGTVYTNLLLLFLVIMSLGVGTVLLGTGELIVMKSKIYIFAQNDVLWRFLLAYGFATLSMTTVMSLSLLLSSFVENAIGPIVGTMAIIIIFIIITALPIDALDVVKPLLFTNYIADWKEFFVDPVDWGNIITSGLVLFGHIVGFYFISLYIFLKKDITS